MRVVKAIECHCQFQFSHVAAEADELVVGLPAARLGISNRQLQRRDAAHQPAQHLPLVAVPDHVLERLQLACVAERLQISIRLHT